MSNNYETPKDMFSRTFFQYLTKIFQVPSRFTAVTYTPSECQDMEIPDLVRHFQKIILRHRRSWQFHYTKTKDSDSNISSTCVSHYQTPKHPPISNTPICENLNAHTLSHSSHQPPKLPMNFTPHSYTDFPPLPSTSTQAPNTSNLNTAQPSYAQAASRSATTRRTKIQHTLHTWKRTHPTLHLILQFVHTQYTHHASSTTDSILETPIDDTLGLISRFGDGAVTRAVVSTVVMEMLNTIERLNFELMLQCDDDIDTLVTYQQRHGTFPPGYEPSLLVAPQRLEDFENVHAFVGLFRRLCGGG